MKQTALLFALLLSTTLFSQSPWTKKKGAIFTQLSFTTISNYNEIFGNPDYTINGNISDRTYQVYAEYGLTDKTSLLLNIPLKSIEQLGYQNPAIDCVGDCSENNTKTAFGNLEIGLKHQFYNNGWVLAGQLITEINTGSYDGATGIRTGYDAFTFTPQFLAGKGFGKTYCQSHIGVQIRTNNYSSNLKIGGEYGGKIFKNFWLIGFIDVVKSFENGNLVLPDNNVANALFVNNQEYGAYGLKTIWEFSNLGVTAGFGSAFFGNNVPKAAAISFGIFNTF